MSVIDYNSPLKLLLSVKGHPYQRDEFFDLFEAMPGVSYSAVEQPLTEHLLAPSVVSEFDSVVFYDMPGLDFQSRPPRFVEPSAQYKANFMAMLEAGVGVVFLHHAIAAWPTWNEYSEIVGGRFLYRPGEVRNKPALDSGYQHAVTYQASVLAQHPVTAGVEPSFEITDELYLCQIFEDSVTSLLRSDYRFDAGHFNSAYAAVADDAPEQWPHPDGSALVGWVKSYRNSPIVYLQMGDTPSAYSNSNYQALLANAVRWVASDDAKQWARRACLRNDL
ncbi:ThuA domain-containing protein [Halioxenophilus aromaticivorans]|uniref:ThuA-like domain-containing protein n=1 Tax=Halioxenophilus aromaticivorans TaxID=1306992 RepID=A0AAV3U725_9ALTE